jgi:hypothetical protein
MDEIARLIAEEYDALLAEIEVAVANQSEADRKNEKLRPKFLAIKDSTEDESVMSTPQDPPYPMPPPPFPVRDPDDAPPDPDEDEPPPVPLPSLSSRDREPDPKLPAPDPDPERDPPGVSPVPRVNQTSPNPTSLIQVRNRCRPEAHARSLTDPQPALAPTAAGN